MTGASRGPTLRVGLNAASIARGAPIANTRGFLRAYMESDESARITVFARRFPWLDEIQDPRIDVVLVSDHLEYRRLARFWYETVQLPALLKDHECGVLLQPANIAVFRSPVPQAHMLYNIAPFYPQRLLGTKGLAAVRRHVLRWLTLLSLHRAETCIFHSRHARDRVRSYAPGANGPVIYYPPLKSDAPGGPGQSRVVDGRYLLVVAHFYRYKRIEGAIRAFGILADTHSDVKLVVAGEPHQQAYAAELRDLVQQLDLTDRVDFLGSVDRDEIPGLFAGAEALLFGTECENAPITLLESLKAGCPVVASSIPASREFAGEAALYADSSRPEEIARAVDRILTEEGLRQQLLSEASRQVARFGWDENVRMTIAELQRIAHRKTD